MELSKGYDLAIPGVRWRRPYCSTLRSLLATDPRPTTIRPAISWVLANKLRGTPSSNVLIYLLTWDNWTFLKNLCLLMLRHLSARCMTCLWNPTPDSKSEAHHFEQRRTWTRYHLQRMLYTYDQTYIWRRALEVSPHVSQRSTCVGRTWRVVDSLDHGMWRCRYLCRRTKVRVSKSLVLPVLLDGCETWILTRDLKQRLNSFGTRSLRRILGFSLVRLFVQRAVAERDSNEICSQHSP